VSRWKKQEDGRDRPSSAIAFWQEMSVSVKRVGYAEPPVTDW